MPFFNLLPLRSTDFSSPQTLLKEIPCLCLNFSSQPHEHLNWPLGDTRVNGKLLCFGHHKRTWNWDIMVSGWLKPCEQRLLNFRIAYSAQFLLLQTSPFRQQFFILLAFFYPCQLCTFCQSILFGIYFFDLFPFSISISTKYFVSINFLSSFLFTPFLPKTDPAIPAELGPCPPLDCSAVLIQSCWMIDVMVILVPGTVLRFDNNDEQVQLTN